MHGTNKMGKHSALSMHSPSAHQWLIKFNSNILAIRTIYIGDRWLGMGKQPFVHIKGLHTNSHMVYLLIFIYRQDRLSNLIQAWMVRNTVGWKRKNAAFLHSIRKRCLIASHRKVFAQSLTQGHENIAPALYALFKCPAA